MLKCSLVAHVVDIRLLAINIKSSREIAAKMKDSPASAENPDTTVEKSDARELVVEILHECVDAADRVVGDASLWETLPFAAEKSLPDVEVSSPLSVPPSPLLTPELERFIVSSIDDSASASASSVETTSVTNLLNDLDDEEDESLLNKGSTTLSKMIKAMRIASSQENPLDMNVGDIENVRETTGAFWLKFKDHVVGLRESGVQVADALRSKSRCHSTDKLVQNLASISDNDGNSRKTKSMEPSKARSDDKVKLPQTTSSGSFDRAITSAASSSQEKILTSLRRLFSKEDVTGSPSKSSSLCFAATNESSSAPNVIGSKDLDDCDRDVPVNSDRIEKQAAEKDNVVPSKGLSTKVSLVLWSFDNCVYANMFYLNNEKDAPQISDLSITPESPCRYSTHSHHIVADQSLIIDIVKPLTAATDVDTTQSSMILSPRHLRCVAPILVEHLLRGVCQEYVCSSEIKKGGVCLNVFDYNNN